MNTDRAFEALGAMRKRELILMVQALSMHSWLNNFEERERLDAGRWALEHWPTFVREQYARLNRRGR